MNQLFKAHAALFVVAFIYGLNYIIAKDVMHGYLEPRGFILLRVVGATALFWGISILRKNFFKIERKDLWRFLLAGIFGVAANQILFFEGLNLTSPINASIIMTANPILVLVLSAIFLREQVRVLRIIGVGLGAMGAYALISGGQVIPLLDSDSSLGNLLVFLNATSYGIYLTVVKPLMSKYPPLFVIKWVFSIGLLFVLPLGLSQFLSAEWSSFPTSIWGQIAFVVIGTTFIAYLFNIFAMKTVSSTTVSIYIYLQPIFATVISLWLGVDSLSPLKLLSAGLIFIGVFLVSYARPKKIGN